MRGNFFRLNSRSAIRGTQRYPSGTPPVPHNGNFWLLKKSIFKVAVCRDICPKEPTTEGGGTLVPANSSKKFPGSLKVKFGYRNNYIQSYRSKMIHFSLPPPGRLFKISKNALSRHFCASRGHFSPTFLKDHFTLEVNTNLI